MRYIFLAVAFLFVLKLIWNIGVPVVGLIAYRRWKLNGGPKPGAVSMAIAVEVFLLILLLVIRALLANSVEYIGLGKLALFGLISVATSYIIVFLVGEIGKRYVINRR